MSNDGKKFKPSGKFDEGLFLYVCRVLVIGIAGNIGKFYIRTLNYTTVYNEDKFWNVINNRPPEQPAITVMNHLNIFDDPFLIASIIPRTALFTPKRIRYTLVAEDMMFTNPFYRALMKSGKGIPVARNGGVEQPAIDGAVEMLNDGLWLNVFPEGKVERDNQLLPMRPGVGRLISDTKVRPLVIPIYHQGTDKIKPIGTIIPRFFNKIDVIIGDPIYFDDLIEYHTKKGSTKMELYSAIAGRIGDELKKLKEQLERLKEKNNKAITP